VHETVARARSHEKKGKKMSGQEHFWKISHKNRKKTVGLGALLEDEVGKKCTRLLPELDLTKKS